MNELRVGVAGLGGFAAEHHAALARLQAEGFCRVVATCDPFVDFDRTADGVKVYPTLEAMLAAEELDLVTLPTPIPLHAEQHRQVIESGAACYLEKPPTLWWPEYLRMLEVENSAWLPTQVGFNFVGDALRIALRHRIRCGEFGRLLELGIANFWPRNFAYYSRNQWAGRQFADGQPVMDSPMGNACAHYVRNLLFWVEDQALVDVAASRWRAHPIENWDTVFLRANFSEGVSGRIAMTHTGHSPSWEREFLRLEHATITFQNWREATITHRDGSVEKLAGSVPDGHCMLVQNLADYLRLVDNRHATKQISNPDGGWIPADLPSTSLEASREFVALNALANLGEPIRNLPEFTEADGHRTVEGLEETLVPFARDGVVPEFVGALPEPVFRSALRNLK